MILVAPHLTSRLCVLVLGVRGQYKQNCDGCQFGVLFQREQEYAEARLRILGEARSPEEQLQIATNDR
jgi:hypothetical protein